MKIFDPLIIHSCVASSKTAIVCCPLASVPAFGSVNPKAPIHSPLAIFGRYFCFCASVPNFKIGQLPKEVCAETTTPVVPQAFDNSSTAIAYIKLSPPADRKSTRLNSSHANISYAVFCLKKKKKQKTH